MSNVNSPRRQDCVVNIDDFAVASSVIKALRSSSNSNRHYKQNASRDDYLVNDISSFNRIIKDRSQEVQRHNVLEQQMNEALNNYIPPTQPMVVVNSPNERKNRQVRISKHENSFFIYFILLLLFNFFYRKQKVPSSIATVTTN